MSNSARVIRGMAGAAGIWAATALAAFAAEAGDYAALTNAIANGVDGDTITLTSDITVSAEVAIDAKGLTLEGSHHSISVPVPGLNESGAVNAGSSPFRVFIILAAGKTNTIRNLTILGGSPNTAGGGIAHAAGTLVLQSVTISQSGGPECVGGGLDNSGGAVFMRDCNLSRNAALYGGGFLNAGTGVKLFMERCTISENRSLDANGGGGAGQNNNTLYANNCTFANNSSTELGGAINNRPTGIAIFTDCTFVGNVASHAGYTGGAIANNNGRVTVVSSLFAYNYRFNGSAFEVNDVCNYVEGSTAPEAYYSVFQSTTNQVGGGSTGNTLYSGNSSGSDDDLFSGGASVEAIGSDGTSLKTTGTIYRAVLAKIGSSLTPVAALNPGSFAVGKGTRVAFSSSPADPVVGYFNGRAWISLSGSGDPAGYEVTLDQNGVDRGCVKTVGAVEPPYSAPVIASPPTNQVAAVGGTLSISSSATGTAPLSYQWFKNGGLLPGATTGTLVRAGAAVTDSGVYYVVITNAFGMSISTPVTVTVGAPQLMTWGLNDGGQFGDGAINTSRSNAISVASNVVAAAAGRAHSLFVKSDGTLWAMGDNSDGQLGDGTWTQRRSPVPVASNVVAAAGGYRHSLFLKGDGTLWAMGQNTYGQLGDGTWTQRRSPVPVASNVVAVTAGTFHSLFLKNDGTLWAMGLNEYGNLGDGTTNNQNRAVCVASNVTALAAGGNHSLFLKSDGTLWGTGKNDKGALGDGTTTNRIRAVCVASNVTALAAGIDHSLYLKGDGTLWAMGANGWGQLGDGTQNTRSNAVFVASNGMTVAAGMYHSLFLKNDGTLWGMGENNWGALGNGTVISHILRPVPASGMSLASVVSGSSAYHTLAVGVPLPPLITRQPASQTACFGSNAMFSVAAEGFAPLAYQWYLNEEAISGATATNVTLAGVAATNAGSYTVVVSNPGGSVTSGVAALTFVKGLASVTLDGLIQTHDGTPRSVTALSVPSGLTVLLTYNGSATAPTAVGTYAVTGTVSDVNWQGSASGTLTVKAAQVIHFTAPLTHPLAGAVGLAATASSGLPVSFNVLSGPGTIAGGTSLTFSAAGIVEVAASQAGDAVYGAAPAVTNWIFVYTVIPDNGPFMGGNTVIINSGYPGMIASVHVGGVPAEIQPIGPDGMPLIMPATGSAGIKDIVVHTADNGDFTLPRAYTVNPAGQIGGSLLVPQGWTGLGAGLLGSSVNALAHDGTNLYAGGSFTAAGGVAARRVALWNGTGWTNLGGGVSGTSVYALVRAGGNLYAGGDFTNAGGVEASGVAKWNGSTWTNLGSGLSGTVRALAHDGANLYAGGSFMAAGGVEASRVALWNGTDWTALGGGLSGTVRALAHDGVNLYAGGDFTNAGGVTANFVAMWNGTNWATLGTGLNGTVRALSRAGSNLYAGGDFSIAGGVEASRVALWNGTGWTALGAGMDDTVSALVYAGTNLYAGGYFTTAGGLPANDVAMWNGASWAGLDSGMSGPVRALAHDGANVYAGGDFLSAGGVAAKRVAMWGPKVIGLSGVVPDRGSRAGDYLVTISGTNLGNGWDITNVTLCGVSASIQSQSATQVVVRAGAAVSIGSGDVRVCSTSYGETVTTNAFTYLENQLISFPGIAPQPVSGSIELSASASSGFPVSFSVRSGPGLIAGGTLSFSAPGTVVVVASQAGDAIYGAALEAIRVIYVYAVAPGRGPQAGGNAVAISIGSPGAITSVQVGGVTAAVQGANENGLSLVMPSFGVAGGKDIVIHTSDNGDFTLAGAYTVNPAGQIGGSTPGPDAWAGLGGGLPGSFVLALAPAGSNLFAGGSFTLAGGAGASIAEWRGTNWNDLGGGLDDTVTALAYDGTNLYAGGYFTMAGGVAANYVARWDGASWTNLGSGMNGPVFALAVAGGNLYAGGEFTTADGEPARRVAMWNGTAWTDLGGGMVGSSVMALAHDGTRLFAGGEFTKAGGVAANRVARWDGATWAGLSSNINGTVYALALEGTNLYAGGAFTTAGAVVANRVALWNGTRWSGLESGMNGTVRALAYSGTHLYAGGYFTTAGGVAAGYVARWNGAGWTNLDSGVSSWVRALAHDGTNLYAGGLFTTAGAVTANNVARWESTVILHSSVTPASGSSAGGYLVFIGGANLGNGLDITNVTLCGISAAIQSQSATQIVVTAGVAASAGGGDVHVYSASYGETMKSNAYTYLAVDQTWNARVQSGDRFGVFSNRFGFTIAGASSLVVVVEGCTNLAHPVWVPLETNILAEGLYYFSDPAWSNYPARFYRLSKP